MMKPIKLIYPALSTSVQRALCRRTLSSTCFYAVDFLQFDLLLACFSNCADRRLAKDLRRLLTCGVSCTLVLHGIFPSLAERRRYAQELLQATQATAALPAAPFLSQVQHSCLQERVTTPARMSRVVYSMDIALVVQSNRQGHLRYPPLPPLQIILQKCQNKTSLIVQAENHTDFVSSAKMIATDRLPPAALLPPPQTTTMQETLHEFL